MTACLPACSCGSAHNRGGWLPACAAICTCRPLGSRELLAGCCDQTVEQGAVGPYIFHNLALAQVLDRRLVDLTGQLACRAGQRWHAGPCIPHLFCSASGRFLAVRCIRASPFVVTLFETGHAHMEGSSHFACGLRAARHPVGCAEGLLRYGVGL